MTKLLISLFLLGTLSYSLDSAAQQSQDFGEYVVHYNALNTKLIPPQVAKGYGIQRSSNRALLNVTVLKKVMDTPGTPVGAQVTALIYATDSWFFNTLGALYIRIGSILSYAY